MENVDADQPGTQLHGAALFIRRRLNKIALVTTPTISTCSHDFPLFCRPCTNTRNYSTRFPTIYAFYRPSRQPLSIIQIKKFLLTNERRTNAMTSIAISDLLNSYNILLGVSIFNIPTAGSIFDRCYFLVHIL